MAIVIEEEQKKSATGIVSVVLWVLLLGGLAAGAYYVFFKSPDIIDVAVPNAFKDTQQISTLKLRPEEVLSNAEFKALSSYVTLPTPVASGRANPFLSF